MFRLCKQNGNCKIYPQDRYQNELMPTKKLMREKITKPIRHFSCRWGSTYRRIVNPIYFQISSKLQLILGIKLSTKVVNMDIIYQSVRSSSRRRLNKGNRYYSDLQVKLEYMIIWCNIQVLIYPFLAFIASFRYINARNYLHGFQTSSKNCEYKKNKIEYVQYKKSWLK